jgi:hypothetical protein
MLPDEQRNRRTNPIRVASPTRQRCRPAARSTPVSTCHLPCSRLTERKETHVVCGCSGGGGGGERRPKGETRGGGEWICWIAHVSMVAGEQPTSQPAASQQHSAQRTNRQTVLRLTNQRRSGGGARGKGPDRPSYLEPHQHKMDEFKECKQQNKLSYKLQTDCGGCIMKECISDELRQF